MPFAPSSFLLLVVRHLFLVAMHLFLVAFLGPKGFAVRVLCISFMVDCARGHEAVLKQTLQAGRCFRAILSIASSKKALLGWILTLYFGTFIPIDARLPGWVISDMHSLWCASCLVEGRGV